MALEQLWRSAVFCTHVAPAAGVPLPANDSLVANIWSLNCEERIIKHSEQAASAGKVTWNTYGNYLFGHQCDNNNYTQPLFACLLLLLPDRKVLFNFRICQLESSDGGGGGS